MFDDKNEILKKLKTLCSDIEIENAAIGKEISVTGNYNLKETSISFFAESISDDIEKTLFLGIKVLENLDELITKAKAHIAEKLLDMYIDENDHVITKKEFIHSFSLASVATINKSVVILDFFDNEIFGHMVSVTSIDGGHSFTDIEM